MKNYLIPIIFSGLPDEDIYRDVQHDERDGLVLIFADAYIPCLIDEDQFILKSIITKDYWSLENEAKLNNLSKKLKQSEKFITMKTTELNKNCYIDQEL